MLARLVLVALCLVLTLAGPTAVALGVSAGSAWPGGAGTGLSRVTSARTPTADGALSWEFVPDEPAAADAPMAGFKNRSDALVVGGEVLYVVGSRLYGIDVATGRATRSCELAGSIDYTCRPVYSGEDGMILVPLHGGALEAVSADTFEEVWATDAVDERQQSLSTPLLAAGRVYLATTDGANPAGSGHLLCVDVATHGLVWDQASNETGYYWAGAAMCSRGLLVGDDAGYLTLRDPGDGHVLARVDLGGPIRTTTVLSADGGTAYVMTRDDGTLHVVDVASMAEVGSVRVCDYSTSTPTVVEGTAYVGGMSAGVGGIFAVDVSDPANPQVTASAKSLPMGSAAGEVKASPLVSAQDGETFVYFTANDENGALYVWKVGDDCFRLLFQPEERQWCVASPVCDADGAIYYANDSSTLFKVVSGGGSASPSEPSSGQEVSGAQRQDGGGGATAAAGESTTSGAAASGISGQAQGQAVGAAASGTTSGAASGGAAGDDSSAGGSDAETIAGDEASPEEAEDPVEVTSDGGTAGDSSGEASDVPEDGAAGDSSGGQVHDGSIPVWPIVGIVAGLVAIVLAVLWPRLGKVAHGRGRDPRREGGAPGGKR